MASTLKTTLLVSSLLVLAAPQSRADLMYGVVDDHLVLLDTQTLSASVIGPIGFFSVGALTRAPDGTLYALESFDSLITVDPQTGQGSLVGPLGAPVIFSTGLAYDPSTDQLYGITGDLTNGSNVLVTISPLDGSATTVGTTNAEFIVGLDFDAMGDLWGIDGGADGVPEELIRIDPVTAFSAPVVPDNLQAFPNIGSLGIGPGGDFWAVNKTGLSSYTLVEIDPVTAVATAAGAITGLAAFTGNFTGMTAVEGPECLLIVGEGAGDAGFLGFGHLFQTQLGSVDSAYAVLMEDIPEFVLPDLWAAGLAGPTGAWQADLASVPVWLADGEFSLQVVMWNPQVFPQQPEQVSAGLSVRMLPGGGVVTRPFGSGAIQIGAETSVNAQGEPVVRFPFVIPRS